MTTDDILEAAMADLATTAPPTLAPAVLVEVGLADRFARIDSPIGPLVVAWNGIGVSAVEAAADDATFERHHQARTGRPARPAGDCRPSSKPASPVGSTATGVSASTSTCGATRTSNAMSGPRPSRSRAARCGRTAGSPPRSAARRRSGPSGRPSVTTRSRSSCRATASSGRTARSASTRSAGRTTSGRSSPPRAWIPTPSRTRPRAGVPLHRLRHDPHRVPADLPQRASASRRRTGCRSGRWPARRHAGYRPCQVCRPVSGGEPRGRLTGLADAAVDIATCRHRSTPPLGPATLCQPAATRGPSALALIWVGMLVLYVVWGSTYLGIAIAVDTIPPFLMAAIRFALAGLILLDLVDRSARRELVRLPTRREFRDCAIVGALLLGGGMGMVAFGEQTIPSGIAALLIAMMPVWVAVLGGVFLGERLPRLAIVGIVDRVRRRRASSSGRRPSAGSGRSTRSASSPSCSRRSAGRTGLALRLAPGDAAATPARRDRARRWSLGGARARGRWRWSTGELADVRPGDGLARIGHRRSST